jgi:putative transposase
MTEETLLLAELRAKAGEGDFLRSVAEAVVQLLMETDVEGLIGAGRQERSGDRTTYRNGYRDRTLDTRLGALQLRIPKLRQGSYFPPFLDPPLPFHVLRARNLGQLRPGKPQRRPWSR